MAKIKGMDISYWQGDIDFKKVAADGIKFAVLRDGYRKSLDNKFVEYVKGCQQNGIYVMAYHFIYTDGATPKQNAQSSYDNLKKAGLDPTQTWIAADLEYDTWTKNGEKCTKEKCTQYTKEYLDALKALGCNKLFIYTNQDYYKNCYDWSQLQYPIWLADYNGDPNYDCAMQQYSPSGKVNGIGGKVDMDWLFDESMMNSTPTTTAPTPSKTTEQIAREVISGKWGSGNERKRQLEVAGYNYRIIQDKVNELLGGGSKTTTPAPAPTNTHANTNVKTDYAQSFSKSIARTYTTTASLRLRTGASTSKAIITVIPKGAKVNCYGYYTGGWYYVQYGNHTGFCSKDWLR